MSVKVIVNGAAGKLGVVASKALEAHPGFNVVACLGRQDSLKEVLIQTKADVVIDVTSADCVYANARTIIEHDAHPVIGTSGLLDEQIQDLIQLCQNKGLGGIIVPNFSISAVLMMQCAALAARLLSEVEIIEAHHEQKKDAPSGTALKTADMIAKARAHLPPPREEQELIQGARGARHQNIPIHSIRLPGILAQQQVIFASAGETLTITHNNIDRSAYGPGIILACQAVLKLKTLVYGLEKVLPQN